MSKEKLTDKPKYNFIKEIDTGFDFSNKHHLLLTFNNFNVKQIWINSKKELWVKNP